MSMEANDFAEYADLAVASIEDILAVVRSKVLGVFLIFLVVGVDRSMSPWWCTKVNSDLTTSEVVGYGEGTLTPPRDVPVGKPRGNNSEIDESEKLYANLMSPSAS